MLRSQLRNPGISSRLMLNKTHSTTVIRRPTEEPDNWGNKDRQDLINNTKNSNHSAKDKDISYNATNNHKNKHDCSDNSKIDYDSSSNITHNHDYIMVSDISYIRDYLFLRLCYW